MSRRRPREELELRLVSEWANSIHPKARKHFRAWLGELPPEAYEAELEGVNPATYQILGKWADLILIYPAHVIIVEAKFKLRADALGQILLYNDLFPKTPHFKEHWHKPRELIVVYAIPDNQVYDALRARGIFCHRYTPEWAQAAYTKRMRRGQIRS